jgi:hypothetical protein
MENENVEFVNRPVQSLVVSPPNYVGGYRLGKEFEYSIQFNLTYKPNRLHRFFMRTCFGWYWFDENKIS